MCQKEPTTITRNPIAAEVSCVCFDFILAFSLFILRIYDIESQLVTRQSKIEMCVLRRLKKYLELFIVLLKPFIII